MFSNIVSLKKLLKNIQTAGDLGRHGAHVMSQ